jgi:hypothetical protein
LIEAVFEQNESTIKAINEGLTHNGIVYKGSASIDNAQGSMTRVQLDVLRIAKVESLKDDLPRSLGHYGQVYQIKQYKYRNYFEGQITILIDTSKRSLVEDTADVTVKPQPLTRMMYLDAWDIYVPASFKGAPPVCFYCRQSGHISAKCPELHVENVSSAAKLDTRNDIVWEEKNVMRENLWRHIYAILATRNRKRLRRLN